MSKHKSLGLNEWWAVRRVNDGFVMPRTLSGTQRDAKEKFMGLYREGNPRYHVWRNHREGRHGMRKVEVVRVAVAVGGEE